MNFKNSSYLFPLRMTKILAIELINASNATGITRSKLCRMGLSRVLEDLKHSGRIQSMKQFNTYYKELE